MQLLNGLAAAAFTSGKPSLIFSANLVTVFRSSSTINTVNSIHEEDAELKWNECERNHLSVGKFFAKFTLFLHTIYDFSMLISGVYTVHSYIVFRRVVILKIKIVTGCIWNWNSII